MKIRYLSKIHLTYNFLFLYRSKQKTTAHRRYQDDVKESVKQSRLRRMMSVYRTEVERLNLAQVGQHHLVLIEGVSDETGFFESIINDKFYVFFFLLEK